MYIANVAPNQACLCVERKVQVSLGQHDHDGMLCFAARLREHALCLLHRY